jgi:hypothetical protein
MNGAIAELCAKITGAPKTKSVISIGIIHQRLLSQKMETNPPAIPRR